MNERIKELLGQAVFFSHRNGIQPGKLIVAEGTVKAHRDNSTQLNRVKVI